MINVTFVNDRGELCFQRTMANIPHVADMVQYDGVFYDVLEVRWSCQSHGGVCVEVQLDTEKNGEQAQPLVASSEN